MSSKKTTNLNLHAWVGTDPFRMDEFNENFGAIDKAVGENASALEKAVGENAAALEKAAEATNSALAGKADTGHTHTKSEITDFPASMTPVSHAAAGATYGAGSSSNYGHVKLSDSTSSTSSTTSGTAATPKAVKAAYDLANTANTTANAAAQVVFGTYTGNDSETRTINLGFTPKAVFLCEESGRTFFANDYYYVYGGLAYTGHPLCVRYSDTFLNVLTIINGGFQIVHKLFSNYRVNTNVKNCIYYYIALK